MADFCIADHFIVGSTPIPKPTWHEKDTWAMRVGSIAPGIQLMQTMDRWTCQRLGGPGIVGICAAYDYLSDESESSFFAGFNYMLDPKGRSDRLFQKTVAAMGNDAKVVSVGVQRYLCLQKPHRYEQAHQSWKAAALPYIESPLARFGGMLVQNEADLLGDHFEFVLGLWTKEHGFVHTGRMGFSLKTRRNGDVEIEATAAHNLLTTSWAGPCAGFLSLQVHQKPVRVALQSWPFEA